MDIKIQQYFYKKQPRFRSSKTSIYCLGCLTNLNQISFKCPQSQTFDEVTLHTRSHYSVCGSIELAVEALW